MKKLLPFFLFLFISSITFAQVSLNANPYKQDFNTLAASGTSSTLPQGWQISEGGTNLNTLYTSGTGSSATGDSYSYGLTAADRALGGLRSGSLIPTNGAGFINQSGSSISSVTISYIGELWRLGTAGRTDKIDFQYSLNSTSLATGTWTDVDALDFSTPNSLGTAGARDGNNAIYRTAVSATITFTNPVPNGSTFYIRWTDIDASGADDGLAVDDFELTYSIAVLPSISINPTSLAFGNKVINTSAVLNYALNANNVSANLTVSSNPPYTISKNGNIFNNSLIYTPAELLNPQTVFVKFSPISIGSFTGLISNVTAGASQSVSLSGSGTNPNPLVVADVFSAYSGELLSGNVATNDSDPSGLVLAFAKLSNPSSGTLVFNIDGSFTYQSIAGDVQTKTFNYRATNSNGASSDGIVTINLAERSKIFISQYYEGTSTNKWIELTNPTNAPINTASPQLKLGLYSVSGDAGNISISGSPVQSLNLNVVIPAKGSVLIGNTGNGTEIPYLTASSANQTSNSVINFNGNDGIALLDVTNSIIDAFGTGINAKDVSYVRNATELSPSPVFIANNWQRVSLANVINAIDIDDPVRLGVQIQPELPACASPKNQPNALTFNATTTKSINFSFAAADSTGGYLIIRSLQSSLSATPVDGTVYITGAPFGGGVVAGNISSLNFTDANLQSGVTYYYYIYSFNNTRCDGGPKYLTINPLSGSQATVPLPVCSVPLAQAKNFSISFFNYNSIQGSFTAATGAEQYLILMSKDSTLVNLPKNNSIYTIGDSIGGAVVISNSPSTVLSRNNLNQDTEYFFYIFSANSSCTGGPLYLVNAPLTGRQKTGVLNSASLNFYYGNLHAHSSFSDGNKDDTSKKPADDYAFAKNSMKMDFLGLSEHNHTQAGMNISNWQPGLDAAKNATTANFVAMQGMEWGVISGGGHVLVFGIDSLIGWEAGQNQIYVPKNTYTGSTGLFNVINRHGKNAFATLAHPNSGDFNNILSTYNSSADDAIVGTALASGPAFSTNTTYSDPASSMSYLSYYNRMLAKGYKLGASIDHDNHNMTFGRHTRSRLVVLAPALTKNDLLDAMKKMRFYASEDSAARVTFTINDEPVGSIIKGNGAPKIKIDAATTSAVSSIYLLSGIPGNGILPDTIAFSNTASLSFSDSTLTNLATGYYYTAITEADGSRIITSPIWYSRDDSFQYSQTLTFKPIANKTYGDAPFAPIVTSTNNTTPIELSSSDATIANILGGKINILKAGIVTITASQASSALYTAAEPKSQVLIILKKAVAVKANAATKTYGSSDPEFTYLVNPSLVNGDVFSGQLSRVAGESVGSYEILLGSLALNSNYSLTYQSDSLIISKKSLLVIADNKTRPYGTQNPELTASYSGFVYGDTELLLITKPVLSTTATLTSPVGTYPILVSGATAQNYSIKDSVGTLSIFTANQVITFQALPVVFEGDPEITPNASASSGLQISFTSSDSTVSVIRNGKIQIVGVGMSTITAAQAGNGNYLAAESVNQLLTVKLLPIPQITSTGTLTFCPGGSVTLSSTEAASYVWLKNGSSVGTGQSFTANSTGSYTVTVTYANGVKKTSASLLVNADDTISPVVLARNITVALVNGVASITTQQADNGTTDNCTIAFLSLSKSSFNCSNIGNNKVTLTATDGSGNTSSAVFTVTVTGEIPAVTISVNRTDNTVTGLPVNTIALGYGAQSLTLTATGGSQYIWSPSTLLSSTTGSSVTFNPKAAGVYTISVQANNQFGCISTATITLKVIDVRCGNKLDKVLLCKPTGSSSNPYTEICVSPNAVPAQLKNGAVLGSCTSISPMATTAVANTNSQIELTVSEVVLKAYPNPFSTSTTVSFTIPSTTNNVVLEIYSVDGKLLKSLYQGVAVGGQEYRFPLNTIDINGQFFLARLTASGKAYTFKLLKE